MDSLDVEEMLRKAGYCAYCRYENNPSMYEPCRSCSWNYLSKFEIKKKGDNNEILDRNKTKW